MGKPEYVILNREVDEILGTLVWTTVRNNSTWHNLTKIQGFALYSPDRTLQLNKTQKHQKNIMMPYHSSVLNINSCQIYLYGKTLLYYFTKFLWTQTLFNC